MDDGSPTLEKGGSLGSRRVPSEVLRQTGLTATPSVLAEATLKNIFKKS